MTYTIEAVEAVLPASGPAGQNELDLPSKEFIGYDPKGTMSVTGSPIERKPKEEPKEEPPAVEPPKEESVTLSKEISAIARKEQAYRRREATLRQREQALEAKLADAEKYQSLRKKLEAKDYSAADELGLTYEEYTQYLLNKQGADKPEEQRYRKVESELQKLTRLQEQATQREYQANQKLWQAEISKTIVDGGDAYSAIRELGAQHLVLQHINDSFEEDGTELTAEQAAKEIEEHLVERGKKFSTLSKIKGPAEESPKTLGAPKASPKTITQSMTVTSQKQPSKPFHMLSEMEQWEEARRRVEAQRIQR